MINILRIRSKTKIGVRNNKKSSIHDRIAAQNTAINNLDYKEDYI